MLTNCLSPFQGLHGNAFLVTFYFRRRKECPDLLKSDQHLKQHRGFFWDADMFVVFLNLVRLWCSLPAHCWVHIGGVETSFMNTVSPEVGCYRMEGTKGIQAKVMWNCRRNSFRPAKVVGQRSCIIAVRRA